MVFLFVLAGYQTGRKDPMPVPYVNWESASVMSNGIRIHYWRTGTRDKPVMIMAHGITDYGLNWSSLAAEFDADYDIIMYDARGHGFSEKPEGPYDLSTHVEDLVGLIRALGIEKPILIGHSMGSGIIALAAATYPQMPRAIILSRTQVVPGSEIEVDSYYPLNCPGALQTCNRRDAPVREG